MEQALQERLHREQAETGPRSELYSYLDGPLVTGCHNILHWWRVCSKAYTSSIYCLNSL